jgi:alkylated DNA nucleotide flippase Atl1
VIGTHQVPLGQRLATHETPNAHRVLQSSGTISLSFRWTDPARTESPRAVLEAEGVMFDENDRASLDQRMTAADLATLSGLSPDVDDIAGTLAGASADAGGRLDSFMAQLDAAQEPAVANAVKEVLRAWADLGGTVHFGSARQTSCFLIARDSDDSAGSLWPVTIYPAGKMEVVFEYMSTRPPFDDNSLRLEFLERLNEAQGVALSPAKIALRPGIPLAALTDEEARGKVIEALAWFLAQANRPRHPESMTAE